MRELLTKWAELEPARCEPFRVGIFTIWTESGAARQIFGPDDLTDLDLAWIQFAVQQAIVERGWSYKVGHDSHYGWGYEAEINDSTAEDKCAQGHSSAAEVLLIAYLAALEGR